MEKKNWNRIDRVADKDNGHYVERTEPGKIDTSDVSAFISGYKAAKKKQ
ncbi:hypothetical protein ACFPYJ_19365 [Paenibacillus solisilvae]|uniref:Uncharacterized protein n=1 Tax=Paenibacillus solisilvae TaxID=2486751 RepID=A0ABW0W486_9BACL